MYEQFFHFKENPFSLSPDSEYLFLSSVHREAFSHLLYAVKQRKGFVILTGEIGAGKTTLCRSMIKQLPMGTQLAHVLSTRLSCEELFRSILTDFGVTVSNSLDKVQLLNELHQFLLQQFSQGNQVIVVIDESQNLDEIVLEELRMVSNLETEKGPLLQIILVGQPELRKKLNHPNLEQLRQRISVRYHLGAMTREDTEQYIRHRIRVASQDNDILRFSDEAFDQIYYASQGIPRIVNIICDNILLSAYVSESTVINNELVTKVLEELSADEVLPSGYVNQIQGSRYFYRFREDPFQSTIHLENVISNTPVFRLTDEICNILPLQREPIIVIGEPGAGKTLFCRLLKYKLKNLSKVCYIENSDGTITDIIHQIFQQFQLNPAHLEKFTSKKELELMKEWELYQLFLSLTETEHPPVLIIDNAERLTSDCARELALWISYMNSYMEKNKLLRLVFVGTSAVLERKNIIERVLYREGIFSTFTIDPMSPGEIEIYISTKLKNSGATHESIHFTEKAIRKIASYSSGNPRNVDRLCTQSVLRGFQQHSHIIDEDIVNEFEPKIEYTFKNRSKDSKTLFMPIIEEEHKPVVLQPNKKGSTNL